MIRPISEFSKSLTQAANFLGVSCDNEIIFSGITANSKNILAGDLFVALPGTKFHGANFIDDAINSGAVAVLTDSAGATIIGSKLPILEMEQVRAFLGPLCSWFYDSPSQNLGVIGITGTNGKTTTASLLNQVWKYAGKETGLIGTVGIEIGSEILPTTHTTPEAPELQAVFATLKERHLESVVMEVSSHGLAVARVLGIRFKMVAFTNLTQDHLDFHGSMDKYFETKAKLFSTEFSDLGFVNIDDQYGEKLFTSNQIQMISISRLNSKAQWHYERMEPVVGGFEVAIRGTGGVLIEGCLNLIGEHNLDNALMAVAMASEGEIDPLVIGNSLKYLVGAPGRLEKVELGQDFLALVDYAHTPDAVERTLTTLKKSVSGRLIAVLGCGGDRDRTKRPVMGKALLSGSDVAIFTSDNPRSENPQTILNEMTAGLELNEKGSVVIDRREAIALAVTQAKAGDCVVLLGKGHESGQEINGVKTAFDDRLELARAIEELT